MPRDLLPHHKRCSSPARLVRNAFYVWLAAFTGAQLAPIILAIAVGTGEPATIWSNVGVVTGVQAVAAMVAAVVLSARFRSITGTFGIDGAMGMHRAFGGGAAALSLVHIVAVIADNPSNVWLLDITGAPARAVAGSAALAALILLVLLAEHRVRYEWWRWLHRGVAAAVLALVMLHVWLLGRLVESAEWLALFALFATALVTAAAWRWLPPDARCAKFIVADIWAESPTVSTVSLMPCGHVFDFEAGQFSWMRLASSAWLEDHPLTMSSPPGHPYIEFTFRHAGDWTSGPLRELRPGVPVWLDGPHGAMTLTAAQDADGFVMVTAGVGLAPVMSILRALDQSGDMRPVWVLTPPDEPLFADALARLAGRLDLTVSRALVRPLTTAHMREALPPLDGLACYVCGPPELVRDATGALVDLGAWRVLTERFDIA